MAGATRRSLRAAWTNRPPAFSPGMWALVLALDRLPWPWGEDIITRVYVLSVLVRPRLLRRALAWASAQGRSGYSRWRLALAVSAARGRFVARSGMTGIADVAGLRDTVSLRGAEHLPVPPRGVIFLAFHIGATTPDVAFRIAGHRVSWIGGEGVWGVDGPAWPSSMGDLYESSSGGDAPPAHPSSTRVRGLYLALRLLRRGENVFITGDGGGRTLAFKVPVPGAVIGIREGWRLLRELSGAPVHPVLSHLEGRMQVVTIYPALPAPLADPPSDLNACRDRLSEILTDHVRRRPEQCYQLALGGGRGRTRARS